MQNKSRIFRGSKGNVLIQNMDPENRGLCLACHSSHPEHSQLQKLRQLSWRRPRRSYLNKRGIRLMNRCFRERWLYNKKPRTLHTVRVFVASIDACHSEVVHAIFEMMIWQRSKSPKLKVIFSLLLAKTKRCMHPKTLAVCSVYTGLWAHSHCLII